MLGPSQTDERRSELINLCEEMLLERRLILVSNRGPVEHQVNSDNHVQARRGTGGVVTALSALTRFVDFTWVASAMGEGDRKVAEASEGTREPLNNSAQAWMGRVVPFFGDVQASL